MRYATRLLATLAILFYSFPALAQYYDERQQAIDSLKGLSGVVVEVNFNSSDALPSDPTGRELRANVEKRLKEAGLDIYQRDWGTKDDHPTFIVSFSYMNFDIFNYEFEFRASLRQTVSLPRNPKLKLSSATWEWATAGLVGGYAKRDEFSDGLDQFICAFRRANPHIKGPLPDCARLSEPLPDFNKQETKQPTVMTELDEQLIRAAGLNEVPEVKSLIAKGAETNTRDHTDTTPLTYAVRSGNRKVGDAEVVRLLLANGANPNAPASCRLTSLTYAVERGDLQVIEALLAHGADPNAATLEGYTALMAASILGSPDAVELLLKKGANVAAQTRHGQTALTLAQLNRNRIAAYDRQTPNAPYDSIPEPTLLKQAQAKHDRVIQLLQSAGPKTRN